MNRDERLIYMFALRYALPRHSCALSCVKSIIIPKLHEFELWELEGMLQDCDFYYPSSDFGGDTCDRPAVDGLKLTLQKEIEKRKEQNENIIYGGTQ